MKVWLSEATLFLDSKAETVMLQKFEKVIYPC